MLAVRKINVSPLNISTSANISPAPCLVLSANAVKTAKAEIMVNIDNSPPSIVSKVEIVFFILFKLNKITLKRDGYKLILTDSLQVKRPVLDPKIRTIFVLNY